MKDYFYKIPKKEKLTIAIDFQGTYDQAPEMWSQIIKIMQVAGHEVICVTSLPRFFPHTSEPMHLDGLEHLVPVVYTGGTQWKDEAVADAGYSVDIWIEDQPMYVGPQAIREYITQNAQRSVSGGSGGGRRS